MTIKRPGQGLCDRQGNRLYSAAAVPGVVIEAVWSEISDGTGAKLGAPAGTKFQTLISQVNTAAADGRWITLRVFCGVYAPDAVKVLTDTCDFYDAAKKDGSVPYKWPAVWNVNYIKAYDALMEGLSAQFDPVAAVRHIQVAGVMTVDPEICLLFRSNRAVNKPLIAGLFDKKGIPPGQRDAKLWLAHQKVIDIHAKYWPNTISMAALNPANMIDVTDDSVTRALQIGDYLIAKCGIQRAMLHNHSLRYRSQGVGYQAIYDAFGDGYHSKGVAPATWRKALVGIQCAQESRIFEGAPGGTTQAPVLYHAYDMTSQHYELPGGYNVPSKQIYLSESDCVTQTTLLTTQWMPY